ncbi:hypothetical protein ACOTJH_29010 [Achromobacter xylosoxidans]
MTTNPQRPGAVTQEDHEIKAAGTLVYGVPYGGRRHYDFSMRLPTMGDNVDALEAHPDASGVRIDLAMFAACMERLGDIPADDIGYELLAEIDPADMDVIYAELAEAKKKRLLPSSDCEPTERSSSSWDGTASPSNASAP